MQKIEMPSNDHEQRDVGEREVAQDLRRHLARAVRLRGI